MSRLVFSIVALAIQLMVARDVIDKISPQLVESPEAIDTWLERMVDFAEAMVKTEQARLLAAAPPKKTTTTRNTMKKRKP
jgi:hypothetical protein